MTHDDLDELFPALPGDHRVPSTISADFGTIDRRTALRVEHA